mmetsp:Transcript_9341/g.17817  ORF Transcript_9341/g.17817 Transcript_9341/m.17817 type:complete len:201 (+) Transcript_9341:258-860(+)
MLRHGVVTTKHHDVSSITPGLAPRVTDLEVGLAAFIVDTVPHRQNTVIQVVATFGVIVDTTLVKSKRLQVGLNGNRYWLYGQGFYEGLFGIVHVGKALDACMRYGLTQTLFRHATSEPVFVSGVWVILLTANTRHVVFDKGERVIHESTTTAHVVLVAIDQLLFRQGHEISRIQIMGPFNGPNGGKGPTGPAHALILDGW